MENTSVKIMDAAMNLIMEKGYSLTTTKDIAKSAGVNECTLFRKFSGKKDIICEAMKLEKWHPDLTHEDFGEYSWNLEEDLIKMSKVYFEKVTKEFVNLSIGLRSPDLYEYTSKGIMKVPEVFKNEVKMYLQNQIERGMLSESVDTEALSMMFLSMNFGFVFMKASFEDRLSDIDKEKYIEKSVKTFVNGGKYENM